MSNGLNGVPSIGTKVAFTEDFLNALATGDEGLDPETAAKRRETRANLTGKIVGSATINTTDYKVLRNGHSCHGGTGNWRPGVPRSVTGDLVPCQNGLHYCRDEQVIGWLDSELWEFEDLTPDECIVYFDKRVTRRGMVTRKYEAWNERTMRLFAVDCLRRMVDGTFIDRDARNLMHACLDMAAGYAEGLIDNQTLQAASDSLRGLEKMLWEHAAKDAESPVVAYGADPLGVVQAAEAVVSQYFVKMIEADGWPDVFGPIDKTGAYILLRRYLDGEEGPFVEAE